MFHQYSSPKKSRISYCKSCRAMSSQWQSSHVNAIDEWNTMDEDPSQSSIKKDQSRAWKKSEKKKSEMRKNEKKKNEMRKNEEEREEEQGRGREDGHSCKSCKMTPVIQSCKRKGRV